MANMTNEAAFLLEPRGSLTVGPADMPAPGPNEVVIKIHTVAINPMDVGIQKTGMMLEDYPAILGSDGAGIVHAIGSKVTNLAVGDRVTACFDGIPPFPKADYRRNSFQRYAVAKSSVVVKIADSVSFNEATVLPLALSSAAHGLFSDMGMELEWPVLDKPKANGQTIIIWGASSSVGTCATQLLRSAGYEVTAVAGTKNQDLCRSVGATSVFDHSCPGVIDDIVAQHQDKNIGGIFNCIMAGDSVTSTVELYEKFNHQGKLGSVFPPGMPLPVEIPDGIEMRRTHGSYLVNTELCRFLWADWIPSSLKAGTLKFAPEPIVFGKGLDKLQGAIDRYTEGVSGQKLVVEFE